ncbi:MAG TPA: AAA family ATPase [Burkholderiaceae bacterium]
MSMHAILTEMDIPQIDLARAANLSRAACNRLVKHGEWPKRRTAEIKQRVAAFLKQMGAPVQVIQDAIDLKKMLPIDAKSIGSTSAAQATELTEDSMLLRNEALTHETKKHFRLVRSPFLDDVQTRNDVFVSPAIRYVRAALMDAATNHGFCAVVGESGSGKSTLVEELEERVRDEGKDVVIIKPYVLAMEENDQKGKTMKSGQLAEAIARCLAPSVSLKSSPEARYRQVHDLLRQSRKAGHTHLLVIEEAHCLPIATLKHLKRFLELKDGLQRLIGVALIGQPELRARLSEQNPEVREVVQRCELVEMEPLDNELDAYLKHKFDRMGLKLEDVFAPDACDAIRARLIRMPRGGKASDAISVCYPLVVNNLVCRAMNAAARAGWPTVDAQVIAGC